MTVREFDCADCGMHVHVFGLRQGDDKIDICATCEWIRGIPDAKDRERIRVFLGLDKTSSEK